MKHFPNPLLMILLAAIMALSLRCYNSPDIVNTINDIRSKTQPGFDSAINAMAAQTRFFDSVKILIKTKN